MRICIFILIFSNIFSQKTKKQELLIPYRDGNLWGLCDTLGIVKVKPLCSLASHVLKKDDYSDILE